MIKLFLKRYKLYKLYKEDNKFGTKTIQRQIKTLEKELFVDERTRFYKQTCYAWCSCGNELTFDDKSFVEDTDFVYYKCSKCNRESKWDFDAPAPILIEEKMI